LNKKAFDLPQADQIEPGLFAKLECGINERRYQADGKQFEVVIARQGVGFS
jgi:hypothetical protein